MKSAVKAEFSGVDLFDGDGNCLAFEGKLLFFRLGRDLSRAFCDEIYKLV